MTPKQAVLKAAEFCLDNDGLCCTAEVEIIYKSLLAFAETLESEPEGWKLVPVEPTFEMNEAIADWLFSDDWRKESNEFQTRCRLDARDLYHAMLAAAPSREG